MVDWLAASDRVFVQWADRFYHRFKAFIALQQPPLIQATHYLEVGRLPARGASGSMHVKVEGCLVSGALSSFGIVIDVTMVSYSTS